MGLNELHSASTSLEGGQRLLGCIQDVAATVLDESGRLVAALSPLWSVQPRKREEDANFSSQHLSKGSFLAHGAR